MRAALLVGCALALFGCKGEPSCPVAPKGTSCPTIGQRCEYTEVICDCNGSKIWECNGGNSDQAVATPEDLKSASHD